MCLHLKMFYAYISLENNFLSYDYITCGAGPQVKFAALPR